MTIEEKKQLENKIRYLEGLIERYKIQVDELNNKLEKYESNGEVKLYYAMRRKASEMAELLNKENLEDLNLGDKQNASFDRLLKIMEKAEVISSAAKSFAETLGLDGEKKPKDELLNKRQVPYSPETVADEVGELAGKRNV